MSENLLRYETSPYLLQHQDNPVHWRAWGPEALAEAVAEDKPILLSVGYAACHWCHVMAHESFENQGIAALMNRLFINIKVDREERPDIDTIYQSALAMLGQNGGWPLTMFLTPAGEPFWGGTYFPAEAKYGRPGFAEVLTAVARTYQDRKAQVETNVAGLRDGLALLAQPKPGEGVTIEAANGIAERLLGVIDPVHGGIGDAPKFPQPSFLRQLWSAGFRTKDSRFHQAVLHTLARICEGGIYDHLGGGFARYAVDRAWLVPHFEKMLYDNGQLLELLALAWAASGQDLFKRRVEETVGWLLSDMQDAEGGFAAARDADSEGVEGKFYVWTEAEIDALLPPIDGEMVKQFYDVTSEGNWEGVSILNRLQLDSDPAPEIEAKLAAARATLLQARAKRIPPMKDDKILTDWNGLTIAGLVRAGSVFQRPDWIAAARRAYDFILTVLTQDGRLLHSYRAGRARHAATLDDYAAMIRAALALAEAENDPACLAQAKTWADILDQHYRDAEGGAYFLTPDDAEALVTRTKTAGDNAIPAGNGLLVASLAQLSLLTGEVRYRDRAEEIVKTFAGELDRNAFPYSHLIDGAVYLQDGAQIVIVGPSDDPATRALRRIADLSPIPDRVILQIAPDVPLPADHPASGKGLVDGRPAAYLCRGMVCSLPHTDPESLRTALVK